LSSSWTSSGKLVGGTWQGCRSLLRLPPGSCCCRGAIQVYVRLSTLVCRHAWSFVTSVRGLPHGRAYVKYKGEITLICCGQSLFSPGFQVQETDVYSSRNCCSFKI
jgi:hypothetical protein